MLIEAEQKANGKNQIYKPMCRIDPWTNLPMLAYQHLRSGVLDINELIPFSLKPKLRFTILVADLWIFLNTLSMISHEMRYTLAAQGIVRIDLWMVFPPRFPTNEEYPLQRQKICFQIILERRQSNNKWKRDLSHSWQRRDSWVHGPPAFKRVLV